MSRGFGLIEALIAASIVASFIVVLVSINTYYANVALQKGPLIKASFLADEGIEAIKSMRDQSWTSNIVPLSNNTNYYLTFNGSGWAATQSVSWIGIFERILILHSVNRDINDNITLVGGSLDPDARLVEVRVSWFDRGATTTKVAKTYITDIFDN